MKKIFAESVLFLMAAAPALAQTDAPEAHVDMVWVWAFVVLFFASIGVVGWMMWRSEVQDRARKEEEAKAKAKAETPKA